MTEIPDNPDLPWFARTLIELLDEVRALRDELRYAPAPMVPNAETIEAIKAAERGELKTFATIDELFADLNSDADD
jgi:hypothetical protein